MSTTLHEGREDGKLDYICPSLSMSCPGSFAPYCRYKHHQRKSYHWQMELPLTNFDNVITFEINDDLVSKYIEKSYSNPDISNIVIQYYTQTISMDFDKMTATASSPIPPPVAEESWWNSIFGLFSKTTDPEPQVIIPSGPVLHIRRLSTPSKVMFQRTPSTTEWCWYWQNDDENVNWSDLIYEQLTDFDLITPYGSLERCYQQMLLNPAYPLLKNFTIPGKYHQFPACVNFNTLTMSINYEEYPIKRRPATFKRFVDWCYLEETVTEPIWVTFGDLNPDGDTFLPISAQQLENHYVSNHDGTFTYGAYKIELEKKLMHVTTKDGKTKNILIKRDLLEATQLINLNNYPTNWDPMPKVRIYTTISVPEYSSEFGQVKAHLPKSYKLIRLRRIQNPTSYDSFLDNKQRLEESFPDIPINSETLFHGTNNMNIKLICEQNFDPSLAGTVNGAVYGKGSYFAKNATYSIRYGQRNKKNIVKLLVCQVLVGPTAQSSWGSRNPTDPMITLVNSKSNPTIFVNRLNHSFYPEHIAEILLPSGFLLM